MSFICLNQPRLWRLAIHCSLLLLLLPPVPARAEVMLQWFETDWDEMYRRMPEVAEIGYDVIWTPPPTKGPTGKGVTWANVGYNLYDRFDVGDVPQRGSLETRYGSRGSLRNMIDAAHALDVQIIPDIIMNHNGNGPDFREYPAMIPEDFHVQWQQGYVNTLNYKRGPRMDQWTPNNGYGGTMWMELAQLIDIRTEDTFDPARFTGGNNTPGWNLVAGQSFLRHPGQPSRYPYYPAGYTNENAAQLLNRWIAWLGNTLDYDGLRLDAGKHTPWEFFGTRGSGFLHEAQYNYNQRRGYSDSNANEADQLFQNDLAVRDDALIFAEILSPWSEIEYWYGSGSNTRNPMRFLDYAMKKHADSKFNGDMNGLGAFGSDFGQAAGITYVWGHDEGPASKALLGYAYILTHIGMPMVYFTGNNIVWANYGRAAYNPANPTANKTWMIPGYDSQALGDVYNEIPNLIWIHQQFAWGNEHKLWENDSDFFALERWSDADSNGRDSGDTLLVMALNDSGNNQSRTLNTRFDAGTVVKDYTGHAGDLTVGVGGSLNVTVPGNGGQGWVCYAPKTADPVNLTFPGASSITWIVPGGTHAANKNRTYPRITSSNLVIDVNFATPGGAVDKVMMKWGKGNVKLGPNPHYTNTADNIVGRFEELTQINATNWNLNVTLPPEIPEGLNVIKARAFNQRTIGQYPALFNTATEVVYVDRHGPDLDIEYPLEGQSVNGDAVMIIRNPDYTAYGMTVGVNGVTNTAHQIMKGLWKFSLVNLPAGPHTLTVTATEADWGSPRTVINQSTATRNITKANNPNAIALNHADGASLQVPFFKTIVTAAGSPTSVRLYWDGYRLPFNSSNFTNTFNGQVIFDADPANISTQRLWGAFVNGQHFLEAVRVDAGITSRAVARVTFNLYGQNHIDTDGDAIPDNVEIPYFSDGAPGPDQPIPGDDNDNIPEAGETWTRLNPYNHSTFYNGQWDDQNDFDGDGYSNYAEVYAGYLESNNIYAYNIYSSASHPTGIPTEASTASWSPTTAVRGSLLTVTYQPKDGALKNAAAIKMHVGHSFKTIGTWQNVIDTNMTFIGSGQWQTTYLVPTNATSVDMTFWDGTTTWDGKDWQATVAGSSNLYFNMNGLADGNDYLIFPGGSGKMEIRAAVRGNNLYVASHSSGGGGNDHMLFVTDELGDAKPSVWGKAGQAFFDKAAKPYLASEGANSFSAWNNVTGSNANGPTVLEGEFNLTDVFGNVPDALYIAAVAYGTADGGTINAQGPDVWNAGNDLEIMEFLRVPTASIRDSDQDGYFDMGKPQMWTVVGANTNDANYGLRRFFLNELAGDTATVTIQLRPNAGGTNVVSNVELFSNINRRDFAVLEEDPDTVTTSSADTYYRAYPMQDLGGGLFAYTMTIHKCGAYRINARYRINGGAYAYYTDHGLRRDCAVVVSPKKALNISMYELNPMSAEATDATFNGRSTFKDMVLANTNKPDRINPAHFTSLGVNMIWLQPIHPIGSDNRGTDPLTGQPFDPGSPYAVRNYWTVNAVLGDPSTPANAMTEFTNFVSAMDGAGVGVMLDGTFNHSAWDCEVGEPGMNMFNWVSNATDLIRDVRPQWYSKRDAYDLPASYYFSGNDNDIAPAPDRIDFGKWTDAADFRFGNYDALVQRTAGDTNNAWSSPWYNRYLREDDNFQGHDTYTRELWEYFAYYPIYWLEKTGHPTGTPATQSWRGIDGLRCDFAQGLPNTFWEFCINKTRTVKWDFLFMAESLDGYRTVAGSNRHGVGFRSARQFDILNENLVFYWRNNFFDYPARNNPQPFTAPTRTAYDDRRQAFDNSPLLLNLTSHDEIYPSHDPYRVLYAHAEIGALDGVPLIFYGQEAGAQNDTATYNYGPGEIPNALHNFTHYEINFGKAIPNFKRYNSMNNIWNNRDFGLQNIYGRINRARLASPALRSQGVYFLDRFSTNSPDPDIFAVAKFEQAGVSASTQDVVFCFVNNNYWGSTNRSATFRVNPTTAGGQNWFGIEAAKTYNIVDLISTNPAAFIWSPSKTGTELLTVGMYVGLNGPTTQGGQAQYLKLIDVNATYPDANTNGTPDYSDWDDDSDGLADAWELQYGLNPNSASGTEGANGDKDNDGASNYEEFIAGTNPNDAADRLHIEAITPAGPNAQITWSTEPGHNYQLEYTDRLPNSPTWQPASTYATALSTNQTSPSAIPPIPTNRLYRVLVRP